MPAEIELSNRSKPEYEGGDGPAEETPKPRKKNPMEKQKEKHAEKLAAFNVREASDIGDTIINLNRQGMNDPVFCVLLIIVFLATIGLAVYGFTAGGTIALAPVLSDGTQCGHGVASLINAAGKESAVDFPYLYFPVPNEVIPAASLWDTAICVKTCPE
jgi:hypothetical protein